MHRSVPIGQNLPNLFSSMTATPKIQSKEYPQRQQQPRDLREVAGPPQSPDLKWALNCLKRQKILRETKSAGLGFSHKQPANYFKSGVWQQWVTFIIKQLFNHLYFKKRALITFIKVVQSKKILFYKIKMVLWLQLLPLFNGINYLREFNF